MTGDRHNANMELVAQGVGNIASGIFGGIPATGAIARTATNIKAGASSPVAGMVHAVTLLFFILFLAPIASAIPLASLSAVLMMVAWDMSDLGRFLRLPRKAPKSDTIVLLTTFILTVVVDLTVAVQVGVILAVFLFLRRMVEVAEIKPESNLAGSLAQEGQSSGHLGKPAPSHSKNVEVYEITGPFFFGVADILQDTLGSLEKPPQSFVLRMGEVPAIDSTGIAALESFYRHCHKRGTRVILCEVREQPKKALERAGFMEEIKVKNCVASIEEAIVNAESKGDI
ncbi:hypothetical protein MASR2M78_14430 [Treponema sp.]